MIGHNFSVVFGDKSWGINSYSFPEEFIEIYTGTIEDVIFLEGRIKITLSPFKLGLTNKIGSPLLPVAYGNCFNVLGKLIDNPTNRYIFNTKRTENGSGDLIIRDKGVVLTETTDYIEQLVGGLFFGEVTFTIPPVGQLTADLNQGTLLKKGIRGVSEEILLDHLLEPKLSYEGDNFDLSNEGNQANAITFGDSGLKMYYASREFDEIYQYTLSSAWDITTASYDSKLFAYAPRRVESIVFKTDGTKFYIMDDLNELIVEYDLSVAWDITTNSLSDTFDVSSEVPDSISLEISTDGTKAYVLGKGELNNYVHRYSMTAWDLTTMSYDNQSRNLVLYSDLANQAIRISNDGTKLYFQNTNFIYQFEMETAFDVSTARWENKGWYTLDEGGSIDFFIGDSGNKMFMLGAPANIFEYDMASSYEFPKLVFETNFGIVDATECGIWINSPKSIGRILKEIVESLDGDFFVNRKGIAYSARLRDPTEADPTWLDKFTLTDADIIERTPGDGIVYEKSTPPIHNFTSYHTKNFSTQTISEIALSVSQTNKDKFSTEKIEITNSNTLSDYPNITEFFQETLLTVALNAADELTRLKALFSVKRHYFKIKMRFNRMVVVKS